jgi:hypothetical protein
MKFIWDRVILGAESLLCSQQSTVRLSFHLCLDLPSSLFYSSSCYQNLVKKRTGEITDLCILIFKMFTQETGSRDCLSIIYSHQSIYECNFDLLLFFPQYPHFSTFSKYLFSCVYTIRSASW